MQCSFNISHDGKTLELWGERAEVGKHIEKWRIYSRLHPDAVLIVSNNRPLLHEKHLYTESYEWKVLNGETLYRGMVEKITNYLECYIKGQWKPPKKGKEKKEVTTGPQGKLFS